MERYENLTMKFFSLDEKSKDYSKNWKMVQMYIDHEKHEIVTRYISRWNSDYNETIRMPL